MSDEDASRGPIGRADEITPRIQEALKGILLDNEGSVSGNAAASRPPSGEAVLVPPDVGFELSEHYVNRR